MKRAYLRLCPKNRQKRKSLVHKGLKKMKMKPHFNAQQDMGVPFDRNFYFILKVGIDKKKKSYERREYESVDGKSLYQVVSRITTKNGSKRVNECM